MPDDSPLSAIVDTLRRQGAIDELALLVRFAGRTGADADFCDDFDRWLATGATQDLHLLAAAYGDALRDPVFASTLDGLDRAVRREDLPLAA